MFNWKTFGFPYPTFWNQCNFLSPNQKKWTQPSSNEDPFFQDPRSLQDQERKISNNMLMWPKFSNLSLGEKYK